MAITREKVEGIVNLLMLNSEQDGRNALGAQPHQNEWTR